MWKHGLDNSIIKYHCDPRLPRAFIAVWKHSRLLGPCTRTTGTYNQNFESFENYYGCRCYAHHLFLEFNGTHSHSNAWLLFNDICFAFYNVCLRIILWKPFTHLMTYDSPHFSYFFLTFLVVSFTIYKYERNLWHKTIEVNAIYKVRLC